MESTKSQLILFTSSFPFGKGEQFIESEILYLAKEFDNITVIPYSYGESTNSREVPLNVLVWPPLKPQGFSPIKLFYKGFFNLISPRIFINELIDKRLYNLNLKKIAFGIRHILVIRMLASDKTLKKLFNSKENRTVIYFYWGKIHSAIIPFINKETPCVVKFHGSDLYEERDKLLGSIPFRKAVLKSLNSAIIVSNDGESYLKNKYPDVSFKTKVFRLGVRFHGTAEFSTDGYLRIVSCSSLKKLKRVDLIAEALKHIDFPVIWTHIGDGPEKAKIMEIKNLLPKNISTNFIGHLSNTDVYNYYKVNPVDLFINVSEYEGVPVSIMEALSFSIPVFGSEVGGIPELIDNNVGKLLPVNITSLELAKLIANFFYLPISEKITLRNHCFKRWNELANAEINYQELSKYLKSLLK